MTAVIQRVQRAKVTVDCETVGEIGKGLFVLVGFSEGDTKEDADIVAAKIPELRIFEDENEKMNFSVSDIEGGILIVPNFTLAASCRKGRRPDFTSAMKPAQATEMFDYFRDKIKESGVFVNTGVFGADMKIECLNDGPVTLILDPEKLRAPRRGGDNAL